MALWLKDIDSGIAQDVQNPVIRALHAAWSERTAPSGLPAMAEFLPRRFEVFVDHLILLQAEGDDFRYRHYGAEVQRYSGLQLEGRLVSEIDPRRVNPILLKYRAVLSERHPCYTVHVSQYGRSVHTWERLILPVHDDQGAPWMLVYCAPLESREHLLAAVLDATQDGVLAVRLWKRGGVADDEWVIALANGHMAGLIGTPAEELPGQRADQAFGLWTSGGLGELCLAVMAQQQPAEVEIAVGDPGPEQRFYGVWVSPVIDGCLLRFADLTRTKRQQEALQDSEHKLRLANMALERLAHEDALTGLANRRAFDLALQQELRRSTRGGCGLALLVLDVDHFKAYNDSCGHEGGDRCLKEMARELQACCRRTGDIAARIGGEEFAVVLPDTTAHGAIQVAQGLRQRLAARALAHPASPVGPCVTVSIGIAHLPPGAAAESADELLRRADGALYRSKHEGRDRVSLA
ncbi:diguanylate cyclase [Ideonella sp. BN130291]|uniref:diguanylate cyclase n=1 Tax=Ideonella sp. BN130291 TaxID=3112940 RepID=UPI002E25BB44|nr:diguanylate cyclase [Ideonella sp. BN130291]